MYKGCFLKSFWKFFFSFFITWQNYANAELDKTELLMNLKNRTLSTEIEYYQEILNIKKTKQKKTKTKTQGISKHGRYFQN